MNCWRHHGKPRMYCRFMYSKYEDKRSEGKFVHTIPGNIILQYCHRRHYLPLVWIFHDRKLINKKYNMEIYN